MDQIVTARRSKRWKRTIGHLLAVALMVSVCSCTAESSADIEVIADSQGAVSVTLDGLPYTLTATPGTFPAGQRVTVGEGTAVPDPGAGRVVAPPIEFISTVQPARPVTVATTEPYDVDPALTVAAMWQPGSSTIQLLPFLRLADGRWQVEVPHFSALSLLTFPTPQDLQRWFEIVVKGVLDSGSDFFNAPYECPPALFSSSLVDSAGYPSSVNLQVDVSDVDVAARIAQVTICNKLRFVMEYTSTGAGYVSGLALPRNSIGLTTPLRGVAGDPFVIDAVLTPDAVTATLLFVAFELLPNGKGVVEKVLKTGLFSPTAVTLIANSTLACASAVATAGIAPGLDQWQTALGCLKDTDEFLRALVQIALDVGVEEAAAVALKTLAPVILGSYAVGRVLMELLLLKPESSVSFPYKLRCGSSGTCAGRPPATSTGPTAPALLEPQIRPTPTNPAVAPAVPTTGGTAPIPGSPGSDSATPIAQPTSTPAAQPSSPSSPAPLADLSIYAVEVRNATRPGSQYFCGDQVNLIMGIDNPNSRPVDSVVEAVVFLNNGQSAFGDGREVSVPVGRSTESWSFTLPTDWFTYPYTYEFVAYLKPGGYFNETGLRASQSSTQFTMECAN